MLRSLRSRHVPNDRRHVDKIIAVAIGRDFNSQFSFCNFFADSWNKNVVGLWFFKGMFFEYVSVPTLMATKIVL